MGCKDGGKLKALDNLDACQNLFYFLGNDSNHDRVHCRQIGLFILG